MSVPSKVSIIIPVYNAAKYLGEAIESVLRQTYSNFEIILVDDGSTDHIDAIISQYEPALKVIRQPNRGLPAARNVGIQGANGNYLVFLDADDLFLPNKLEIQARFLDVNPEIGVVYSDGYRIKRLQKGEKKELFSNCGCLTKSLRDPRLTKKTLMFRNGFPVHAAMVRRECVVEAGGFDEGFVALEDWDLWFRISQRSVFEYVEIPLVIYRLLETGMSRDRGRMRLASNRLVEKIERSKSFVSLSDQDKSDILLKWGAMALEYHDKSEALHRFRKSIRFNPLNLAAKNAYMFTLIFGNTAVIFLHIKKLVFGPS